MPLLNTIHDSLPYIDNEPTPHERAAALALITTELANNDTSSPHPSLPPLPTHTFSPLIEAEHHRISQKTPLTAINLTRYESLNAPLDPSALPPWREALTHAQTSHCYLQTRQTNLALLHQYGKNAWLIGNSQLEDILRGLEKELAERKAEIDAVVIARKTAQEGVGPEVRGLEEGWRRGVGRVLETEVACEQLRREILERRRGGAS